MKVLFDTHALLWFLEGHPDLPNKWRSFGDASAKKVEDRQGIRMFSFASYWEIAIKINLGKLVLSTPFPTLASQISSLGFEWVQITQSHIHEVATLPLHHRDPFDRLLIAQARVERIKILSIDPEFRRYSVDCVW